MNLTHIELSDLKISACNMRYRDPAPDISDILPSIRAKGVLLPLIVRPEDGRYGIVAGRRRYFALKAIKAESGAVEAPPCAVMEADDDAEAIELSLLENTARRDPDPMREYETFVRLIKEGRTVDGIAATFGMTGAQVKQRLALGNLLPGIRGAYRAEEIDDETVRHLTLASASQQKKWLRLYKDLEQYVPRGYQLKQWLFGGQQIATAHALFPLTDYSGQIVQDLFGDEGYFADADLFWALQNRAIAAKREALLKAGWPSVEVLEIGQRFAEWEHVKTPKAKGGTVFITVAHDGTVTLHSGWLSRKEAQKRAKAEAREADKDEPKRTQSAGPTISHGLQNYLDLHRHAVVRLALIAHPGAALRLAVAHMLAPSGNWHVAADPQNARSHAIRDSVEGCAAQAAFDTERSAVYALLGWQEDDEGGFVSRPDTAELFAHLLTLDDAVVLRIAAFAMAQSLAAGSDLVEAVGAELQAEARGLWQADDTFFDLIRDRATLNALLGEVAGESVARANVAEKAKLQKQIIRDCLSGTNGRTKKENWLPGWPEFPARPIAQSAGDTGEPRVADPADDAAETIASAA